MITERNELTISRWLVLGTVVAHMSSSGLSILQGGEVAGPFQNVTNTERQESLSYIGMSWPGLAPRGQKVNVAIPDARVCPAGFAGSAAVAGKPAKARVGINQVSAGVAVSRGEISFSGVTGWPTGSGMWLSHNDAVQFVFPENEDLVDVAITLKCTRS